MKVFYENVIEEFEFSVEKALADYAKISEKEATGIINRLTLNDYAGLVAALDANNENEITRLVDKYMNAASITEKFYFDTTDANELFECLSKVDFSNKRLNKIMEGSIEQIMNTKVVSAFPYNEKFAVLSLLPETFVHAYNAVEKLDEDEIVEYLGHWLTESVDEYTMYDMAAFKAIFENENQQFKNNLAGMVGKSSSMVKNPTMTDPKTNVKKNIISADRNSNTIATADEKGNVEIKKVDPMTKKQIALEELRTLIGKK